MKGLNLFRSRLSAVEAFLSAKPEERTAEMLAAAQAEFDRESGGLILLPKSDTVQSAADLQKHIDTLTKAADDAVKAEHVAKAAAETAQKALTELKGSRVLPTQRVTSDRGEGGDHNKDEATKAFEAARAEVHGKPYMQRVLRMIEHN